MDNVIVGHMVEYERLRAAHGSDFWYSDYVWLITKVTDLTIEELEAMPAHRLNAMVADVRTNCRRMHEVKTVSEDRFSCEGVEFRELYGRDLRYPVGTETAQDKLLHQVVCVTELSRQEVLEMDFSLFTSISRFLNFRPA